MERYGTHCEQTYRTNFNRGRAKCIDWVKFNLALCRRYLNMDGLLAIAIDPSYISKSGKKTPHIGTFWSGCASSMKHGLEIMGLALVDVHANSCMMLRAHQTPSTGELKMRNMTLVQHYIAVIKRYKKDLLKVTDIVVADAFFSIRPFVDGIKECGFHLVSRFRDTASLYYVYTGPRSNKPGRPKTLDGKINYKKLDLTRMAELHIEGLEGTAYTLIAYSKALKQKVRLVIWVMPNGKHKLFFSTKTSMSGEEVLRTYRSRFQIEFCFRDAKQYTGLTHCQARHKNQLDFSYNASFASQNVAKVMMKVVTTEELINIDKKTTEKIPSILLMEHVALDIFNLLEERYAETLNNHFVHIFSSVGGNGGDGFAVARYLIKNGYNVNVYITGNLDKVNKDTYANFNILKSMNVEIKYLGSEENV